ncbi:MAG: hypothetical protein JSR09_09660 [Bacteroidetes bacterium]|nr:hypothetical protein [Bacteroidota bacterium]MBS1765673.1 hypothetical protein [Bacteroidota bacterium]
MNFSDGTAPRPVIISLGIGLILMAFFTFFWGGLAGANLTDTEMWVCFGLIDIIALTFICYAIHLFIISKKFPVTRGVDIERQKMMVKKYGIIFGIEGLLIAISVLILKYIRFDNLIIPTIAIIVGLHFLPMANLFQRKLDYYSATWTTVVGIIGVALALTKILPDKTIQIIVGISVALVTTLYGIYMIVQAENYKSIV